MTTISNLSQKLEKFIKDVIERVKQNQKAVILVAGGLILLKRLNDIRKFMQIPNAFSQNELEKLRSDFRKDREASIESILIECQSLFQQRKEFIINLTALELAHKIQIKQITCVQALISFAQRAVTVGQKFHVLSDINFKMALQEAKEKDEFLQSQKSENLPILFGVPISFQEQLVCKGLRSTAGLTYLLAREPFKQDNDIAHILREHGAIIFANSNVPQALFSLESSNRIYGTALNPWNSAFTCGGSSGGQAGMIASLSSPLGIGSDSAGSLRVPAAFCGVFSFKPTGRRMTQKGRLNLNGMEGGSFQDLETSIGPISRSVDDLIETQKISIHQNDWEYPHMEWNEKFFKSDPQTFKIAYFTSTKGFKSHKALENIVTEVANRLKQQGFNVQEYEFPEIDLITQRIWSILSSFNLYGNIRKYLRGQQEITHLRYENPLHFILPGWMQWLGVKYYQMKGEKRHANILNGTGMRDFAGFFKIMIEKDTAKTSLINKFKAEKIDLIISPVFPLANLKPGQSNMGLNMLSMCTYQNVLDQPSGVMPIRLIKDDELTYDDGINDSYTQLSKQNAIQSAGLPGSIQITGMCWQDEKVLCMMKYIDNLFKFRQIAPSQKK